MTQKEQKIDFEEAVRAVKADEPDAEALSQAGGRLAMLLRHEAGKSDEGAALRGCEDIQRAMPKYLAGQLSSERTLVINAHLLECVACRRYFNGESAVESVDWSIPRLAQHAGKSMRFRFALALSAACMALAAFFGYTSYFAVPAGARARVESLDGDAYRMTASGTRKATIGDELADGEFLRTAAGSHVYLKLQDGSILETRERSQLAVNARGRNLSVALDQGAVIVQAAHRKTGHLYVRTPDARVAVTGTIFAVNAGIKGSRVAVMEGTVEVAHAGVEDILHAGDQVATSDNMRLGSLEQEVAWSRDRAKYLALISQFAALQSRLAKVQMPAPRYDSDLLDRVPSSAVLYISIPNLGEVLGQSNEILQEQLRVSPELRQWFTNGKQGHGDLSSTIATIQAVSQYLGNEIVIAGFEGGGNHPGLAVLANLERSGFADYLRTQFSASAGSRGVRVVEPRDLASVSSSAREEAIALVRANEVVFANNVETLRRVNAQLDAGDSGMSSTDFGRQIASAYSRGAGFFLAADMKRILHDSRNRNERGDKMLDQTGLGGMRYILAEHREINGVPDNHLDLQFQDQRRGIASWLAAPAPMGSLDFISANAALSVSVVAKEPREIVDDILQFAAGDNQRAERDWSELEDKLQVRLRDDLAAQLGGDVAFALDGPVLPTPAWKFVVEIHDSSRLQDTLQRIVQSISNQMRQHGGAGLAIIAEDVDGRRFYRIQENSGKSSVDYTFADGYMIAAANRAILMSALKTHAAGDSLARSSAFRSILPKDENLNYSGIAYQNLSPVLQPLLSQLQGQQAKTLQQFAADARPTVVCIWGRENRIEAASNSRLLGLDLFTFFTMLDFENKAAGNRVQRSDGHD